MTLTAKSVESSLSFDSAMLTPPLCLNYSIIVRKVKVKYPSDVK